MKNLIKLKAKEIAIKNNRDSKNSIYNDERIYDLTGIEKIGDEEYLILDFFEDIKWTLYTSDRICYKNNKQSFTIQLNDIRIVHIYSNYLKVHRKYRLFPKHIDVNLLSMLSISESIEFMLDEIGVSVKYPEWDKLK